MKTASLRDLPGRRLETETRHRQTTLSFTFQFGRIALALATALAFPLGVLNVRAAEDTFDLKPKWKPGQQIVQQIKTAQKQKITVASAPNPIQQQTEQTQEVALAVEKERAEGGFEVGIEFRSITLETKMGQTVLMKFDSKAKTTTGEPNLFAASGGANPLTEVLKKLVGAKLKLYTKPNGDIEKVEGVQKLIDDMASSLPEMAAGMMKSMFNEDMVKQMSALPPGLPQEPVSAGYEWPVKLEMSLGPMGTMLISMKFKFNGMEEKRGYRVAVLDHQGTLSSKEGSGTGPITLGAFSGTTTGRTWYAPDLGATVDSFANQVMSMTMKTMGQDTKVEMDQRVTTKLLEVTGQAK